VEFQRVAAGPCVGHDVKVDGQGCLVVEGPDGQAYGALRAKVNDQRASRRDPKTLGTILEAVDGSWFVPNLQQLREKHRPVLDGAGKEVAGVDHTSLSRRELQLPGGPLTWERHTARPQYRIEGFFGASRSALHTFAAGVSRRPFNGEITEALASRSDASLVLLLACWLTSASIDAKAAASSG
jgi:hypothetical protein